MNGVKHSLLTTTSAKMAAKKQPTTKGSTFPLPLCDKKSTATKKSNNAIKKNT